MNLLDLMVVVLVAAALVWGVTTGVSVQLGAYLGFLAGLYLGALLAPEVVGWGSTPYWRAVLTLLAGRDSGGGVGCRGRSRRAADRRARGAHPSGGSRPGARWSCRCHRDAPRRLAGRGSASAARTADVGPLVQGSAIIRALDGWLPPAPEATARLERLIDPLDFPRIFAGLEPETRDPVAPPTDAEVAAAAARSGPSTVKVSGRGCGGILQGSGFVAAPGLVLTNAHVIAGVHDIVVEDTAGSRPATPVLFDPALDLAVLRTHGLAGPPLPLAAADAPRSAVGAVVGYPQGGGLTTTPAAVLATYSALGRDIYGEALVSRRVYALQATVRPGNSGGPFALPDGSVAGIVFAASVSDSAVGYALMGSEVRGDLDRAAASSGPVSTGACVAG